VRVVHHYSGKSEFVLLGGLVPQLLCSNATFRLVRTALSFLRDEISAALVADRNRRGHGFVWPSAWRRKCFALKA